MEQVAKPKAVKKPKKTTSKEQMIIGLKLMIGERQFIINKLDAEIVTLMMKIDEAEAQASTK